MQPRNRFGILIEKYEALGGATVSRKLDRFGRLLRPFCRRRRWSQGRGSLLGWERNAATHVYAITWRGYGASGKPQRGYFGSGVGRGRLAHHRCAENNQARCCGAFDGRV